MSSFDQPLPPYNASDPTATFVGTSCLDLLLIELVPMAYRIANELGEASDDGGGGGGGGNSSKNNEEAGSVSTTAGTISTAPGTMSATGRKSKLDEDEEREAVFFRLEGLGYRVGLGLVERYGFAPPFSLNPFFLRAILDQALVLQLPYTTAYMTFNPIFTFHTNTEPETRSFSRDRPRFTDTLDAIKFVCKDLWMLVFKKQVDNLKTNHRGVYVLTDHAFRPLSRMSVDAGGQAVARAQPFLWFPCGILRGALAAMGISATVQAETSELPGAVFQIKTTPAAPNCCMDGAKVRTSKQETRPFPTPSNPEKEDKSGVQPSPSPSPSQSEDANCKPEKGNTKSSSLTRK
ncbi:BET3 family protein [Ustulina deusta]|nr:BET3 family protein [Ustulina deusta]